MHSQTTRHNGVHWIAFSTQSSALAPYNYYTNTDTVTVGANTFEHQVSHSQSRSQSVPQNERGHSCGLSCNGLPRDFDIRQHMNQNHCDKKSGTVYCLDHKKKILWKNYPRHFKAKHIKLKPFRCVMCQKSFGEKFNAKPTVQIVEIPTTNTSFLHHSAEG
ncbi:uncharacterized protein ARMOST_03075 [Armillaria ostoyae]|uniref:C2H2-type domain-containing protein n=1 Tax=Armillaria ostoyae TaxID=47428 RepID=A0A284QTF7_ARMOS|nr:uncharacterized protein ARMOST_03075 [Armillaria ostoyae]